MCTIDFSLVKKYHFYIDPSFGKHLQKFYVICIIIVYYSFENVCCYVDTKLRLVVLVTCIAATIASIPFPKRVMHLGIRERDESVFPPTKYSRCIPRGTTGMKN